jgi:hypothetical protein
VNTGSSSTPPPKPATADSNANANAAAEAACNVGSTSVITRSPVDGRQGEGLLPVGGGGQGVPAAVDSLGSVLDAAAAELVNERAACTATTLRPHEHDPCLLSGSACGVTGGQGWSRLGESNPGGFVSSRDVSSKRVVIAVDSHKASWTAAVVNSLLQPLAMVRVPVSAAGYRQLRRFAGRSA